MEYLYLYCNECNNSEKLEYQYSHLVCPSYVELNERIHSFCFTKIIFNKKNVIFVSKSILITLIKFQS